MASRAEFLQKLGYVVVQWNRLEGGMRDLLVALVGPGDTARILTDELGAVALENALLSIAGFTSGDAQRGIEHAVKSFTHLRIRRNYYIHGIHSLAPSEDGRGSILVWEAKGAVRFSRDEVLADDLDAMLAELDAAYLYVISLGQWLRRPLIERRALSEPPAMPPLPAKLEKPWQPSPFRTQS